jgi:hypothetical protein
MNYLQTVLLSIVLASWIIVAIDTDSFANEEVSPTAQQYLMNLSMTKQDAYVFISECETTQRPNKCIMYWGAIRAQEWGYDTRHPFGMLRQPSRYKWEVKAKTTAEYAELRVWSFTKYRHRNNKPSDYLTRSNYCTDGCQHWIPNVTRFIVWYESGVIPQDIWPTGTAEKINYYQNALEAEQRKSQLFEQLQQAKNEAHIARKECIDSKQCK